MSAGTRRRAKMKRRKKNKVKLDRDNKLHINAKGGKATSINEVADHVKENKSN